MKKRHFLIITGLVAVMATPLLASNPRGLDDGFDYAIANADNPMASLYTHESIIDERQAVFRYMKRSVDHLDEMAKDNSSKYNRIEAVVTSKSLLDDVVRVHRQFSITAPGGDASRDIWDQSQEFNKYMMSMKRNSRKLVDNAARDQEALHHALNNVKQSCGSCHDKFKT